MKNVERKKGRIRILATSIAQIVVGRKTRRERAGAGERASCAGGREAVINGRRAAKGPQVRFQSAHLAGTTNPFAGRHSVIRRL